MTQTTHDSTIEERYTQQYSEPSSDAPRSSGYVDLTGAYLHTNGRPERSNVDELVALLNGSRNSITDAQLAAIKKLLGG
jgi:hypothetical protein